MSTNWSMSKDVQLFISYCGQLVDPISGARQKVIKLLEKFDTDFQANWVRRNPESGCNFQDEIRKAQVLYVAKKKKTFIHFDCWEHVKNHQTFAIIEANQASPVVEEEHTLDVPPTPSTEVPEFSTPESNPGSSTSPIRAPGVKVAKEARRKCKKVANPLTNEALMTIAENQKKFFELNQKQMENDFKLQEKAFNLAKMEEETKNMQMNTDVMTPKSKRYFSKRKAVILREYEEDVPNNDQDAPGDYSDCYRPSF
ncbi:hypothetical protein QQ045_032903 [Rhodiola kirilowii]